MTTIKDLIVPLDEPVVEEEIWNVATYGKGGSGKTFFARLVGQVPGWSPALLVDIDGGSITAKQRGSPGLSLLRLDDVFKMREKLPGNPDDGLRWRTFCHIIDTLEAGFSRGRRPYNMVILDGFSILVDWVDKLIDKVHGDKEPEPIAWSEYRFVRARIVDIVLRLRDLPVPVWVTAGEKKTVIRPANRNNAEKSFFEPAFPPAVSSIFSQLFDVVGRHTKENIQGRQTFLLHTKLSDDYEAKSRAVGMPSPITIGDANAMAAMTSFAKALHVPMERVERETSGELPVVQEEPEEGGEFVGMEP